MNIEVQKCDYIEYKLIIAAAEVSESIGSTCVEGGKLLLQETIWEICACPARLKHLLPTLTHPSHNLA